MKLSFVRLGLLASLSVGTIAHADAGASMVIKCTGSGTTVTINYLLPMAPQNGVKSESYRSTYTSETVTQYGEGSSDDVRRVRKLTSFEVVQGALTTTISGKYEDQVFGGPGYKYTLTGTLHNDPTSSASSIIITRSYYDEAKGFVNDEAYSEMDDLTCINGPVIP